MKKICYIVTVAVTFRAFFIPQLKYLQKNGFLVTVICSPDELLSLELGEQIHFIPIEMPRGISIGASITAIRRLIEVFRKEQFDMVQYSTPNAAFYASIASKWSGIKIRNYHLMGFRYLGANGIGKQFLKLLEKVTCALSTNIECVSKSILNLGVKQKIFPQKKAIIVWNGSTGGVDLKKFDYSKKYEWRKEVRDKLGYSETEYVFGFAGRITKDKGINELLAAFFSLGLSAKLLIVGEAEGIETLNLELWERAIKDKNVYIHAPVKDIERYYAAMDILLLPSYREGFGNVIIEAAAMGIPSIVSDIPGLIDAVKEGATASIVPSHNIKELKKTMRNVVLHRIDFQEADCVRFAVDKYDSLQLCEKNFKRKRELLQ